MSRRRVMTNILLVLLALGLIWLGIRLFQDRRYNLISVLMALSACVPFYYAYEKREGSIRRMVLLAVMTALAVAGRFIFAMLPGFKPVTAIVILSGMYMGAEAGFLVGSLTAIISNMFFGQGLFYLHKNGFCFGKTRRTNPLLLQGSRIFLRKTWRIL